MIISHQNRFLFVEIPQTASVAISHELRANYGGEQILEKHSFYSDFLKIATPRQKKYFVFAGIRNPLDDVVTWYFKLKTNYGQEFTDPVKRKRIKMVRKLIGTRMFENVHREGMDFPTFFMKYYKRPYNNFSCLIRNHYDYLIRFENLQADFARLLQILGLELKRPLPVRNPTKSRNKDFWSYYSPEMIPRAKKVFGPFMKEWGYEFPADWGNYSPSRCNQLEYKWFSLLRKIKWNYLRFL
jgi:hypothetical protein